MRLCHFFEHCGRGAKFGPCCVSCKRVNRRHMALPCLVCGGKTAMEIILPCGHVVCSQCASHTLGTSNTVPLGVSPPFNREDLVVPSLCTGCGLNNCICIVGAKWMSPDQTLHNFLHRDLAKGACLLCHPRTENLDGREQLVPRADPCNVWTPEEGPAQQVVERRVHRLTPKAL